MSDELTIHFWGVRGTLPTPGADYARYGGNTSCVEVRCGGKHIIFDAGTGLRALGAAHASMEADIFLSHTHIDHIQGFPFFRPLYSQMSAIYLWAGHLQPEYRLEQVLGQLMQPPIFPLLVKDLKASLTFADFPAGQSIHSHRLESAGIVMRTLPLLHPDRATAYRLQFQNKSVCYVTDVEHRIGELDAALVDFIRDADVFIYDSTYTDEEFATYKGWGHSTWQQAVRLAKAADVKKLVTFHHDPQKNDTQLDEIASELSALMSSAQLAREGLVIGV